MVRISFVIPPLEEVFGFEERWFSQNLSLLENAKDSLRHGLDHYLRPDAMPSDFKQAIINIHQGFELALKEALRRRHPALIVDRLDDAMLHAVLEGRWV